jgi:hypothetical protein
VLHALEPGHALLALPDAQDLLQLFDAQIID